MSCKPEECVRYAQVQVTLAIGWSDKTRTPDEMGEELVRLLQGQPIEGSFIGHARVSGLVDLKPIRAEFTGTGLSVVK
jgi:hypothetical protein